MSSQYSRKTAVVLVILVISRFIFLIRIVLVFFIIVCKYCLMKISFPEITSAIYSQTTKAVYGVEVAPYDDNYVVSFGDNQIAVWDTRNLEKSILSLTQSKIVSKVSWCPTR